MNKNDVKVAKKLELLQSVSKGLSVVVACKLYGYSRDSYYRFLKLYRQGGEQALRNKPKKGVPLYGNRVSNELEANLIRLSLQNPKFGKYKIANIVQSYGFVISPAGVRSVWLRHDLETSVKRVAQAKVNTR